MLEADSTPPDSGGIREILENLDRATQEFTHRLEELAALGVSPARTNGTKPHGEAHARSPEPASVPARAESPGSSPPPVEPVERSAMAPSLGLGAGTAVERPPVDLERRMAEADAEAKLYFEDAKRRADAMVQSIIGAVEAEAQELHRDAEQRIRERWRQVEADAEDFLAGARRTADGLVAERRRRISEVSDTIVGLAEVLTERMADADRLRRQFDSLVVTLSATAERLAEEPAGPDDPAAAPRQAPEIARP